MLTFKGCPFCIKARDYLDAYSIPYNDVILEELEGGQALRLELAERYGRTSVPAVFINSEFIGGWSDGNPGLSNLPASKIREMLSPSDSPPPKP
ncbi:hypothetical protein TrRE_jg12666 [Triparma retinervis]|uniref:Glutaredoxin domain-containing protein n=1 Tax=Triparma retinervis TaxID=2557542 RepID=A0A9W7DW27_9STRA|nr:hypothetical protein TrRE_jg12666 [Triparma retinervis]